MSRTVLAAPLTLYVAPSGSDTTGDGSVGTPWATPQFAAQWLQRNIDLGDETATIHLGSGTYTSGVQVLAPFVGGNINAVAGVTFSGDTTNPANVVIAITNGLAFQASFGAKFAVEGMKLTVAGSGDALYASAGGAIYVSGPMEFGAVPSTQNGSHMHVTVGGAIVGSADYKISGGGSIHFFADRGGVIEYNSGTATLTGTPAFSGAFAFANDTGLIYNSQLNFSGSATGQRYYAQTGGVIQTIGRGVNFYPGSVAGGVDSSSCGVYR